MCGAPRKLTTFIQELQKNAKQSGCHGRSSCHVTFMLSCDILNRLVHKNVTSVTNFSKILTAKVTGS